MAELDYAFVADYARVEPNGTLTAIGASWTFLHVESLPSGHRMAVAGRVRARLDEGPISLRIDFRAPEGTFNLAAQSELAAEAHTKTYGDGLVGLLFALDLQVPLPVAGRYGIDISLEGEVARRLYFEVSGPGPV